MKVLLVLTMLFACSKCDPDHRRESGSSPSSCAFLRETPSKSSFPLQSLRSHFCI